MRLALQPAYLRQSSISGLGATLAFHDGRLALDHIAPVLSKPDRTTFTLATPNLTSGVTTPGQCPEMVKNQIDLRFVANATN